MQTRRLGSSGLEVSEIALGSWLTLGSKVDVSATVHQVHKAFDLGICLFDTADVYANGAAEEALGEAIAGLPREQLVVASKCYFATSEHPNDRGLSRKHVVESVEGSLRRLGTDYLDLHQCHRYDEEVPLEETIVAYADLIRAGKLLYWGVSRWRAHQIVDACRLADALGAPRPVSNQPRYSIVRRNLERDALPVCRRFGLGQIGFSPLAQGALSGKYSGGGRPSDSRAADRSRSRWMSEYLEADLLERIDRLRPIAEELGWSMPQLALAWCLRDPGVASVIVGATRDEQLEDNCKASGLVLPDGVAERIDAVFPPPEPVEDD